MPVLVSAGEPIWPLQPGSDGCQNPEKLPKHLLADEKVTWLNGEEVVVATTVGDDCVLGASGGVGNRYT